jgi:putative heme-binding domain-containing protein
MRLPLRVRVAICFFLCLLPSTAQEGRETEKEVPEKNPFDTAADAARGQQYFLGHCAHCHGQQGEGGRGVNLTTGQYRHGGSDRELHRTIRRGVPGSEMPGSGLAEPEIWRLVSYVRRLGAAGTGEQATGDPAAGKMSYESKGCAQCHVANGQGGRLGPDLSEIGRRRSLKFLRESLTDPNAFVAEDYRTVTIVPSRAGSAVTGVLLNEDDYSVHLRDTGENLRSFLKSDLKEVIRESRSMMPSYASMLSAVEIDNLVAYLSSLRGKP